MIDDRRGTKGRRVKDEKTMDEKDTKETNNRLSS